MLAITFILSVVSFKIIVVQLIYLTTWLYSIFKYVYIKCQFIDPDGHGAKPSVFSKHYKMIFYLLRHE